GVVTSADLSVTKVDSPDPVVAGTNLTYTITLSNAGPSDAQAVALTDTLPANTTFVSATTPPGFTATTPAVGGSGGITALAPTLAAGASGTFTVVVHVNSSAPQGSTISNTATATSSTSDSNTANNSATATTAVNAQADLGITKTGPTASVEEGTN